MKCGFKKKNENPLEIPLEIPPELRGLSLPDKYINLKKLGSGG